MDNSSIIGLFLAILAVGIGMILKGISLVHFFNPAAILIIFFGTAAAVLIAFPARTIKNIPYLIKIIFVEEEQYEIEELITTFTSWCTLIRQEGILSLEDKIDGIDDPFLKSGLQMAVDGEKPDFIRELLTDKIIAMEERHKEGAAVFSQAGTYAPTLGVLGAVVGLIAALGNMNDMAVLGAAISAAFMATLFGIFSGYMLWHPFANKLKEKSKREAQIKYVLAEGIASLTEGVSPQTMEDILSSYLSTNDLIAFRKRENEVGSLSEDTAVKTGG